MEHIYSSHCSLAETKQMVTGNTDNNGFYKYIDWIVFLNFYVSENKSVASVT